MNTINHIIRFVPQGDVSTLILPRSASVAF